MPEFLVRTSDKGPDKTHRKRGEIVDVVISKKQPMDWGNKALVKGQRIAIHVPDEDMNEIEARSFVDNIDGQRLFKLNIDHPAIVKYIESTHVINLEADHLRAIKVKNG